jgi:hypothetical protein
MATHGFQPAVQDWVNTVLLVVANLILLPVLYISLVLIHIFVYNWDAHHPTFLHKYARSWIYVLLITLLAVSALLHGEFWTRSYGVSALWGLRYGLYMTLDWVKVFWGTQLAVLAFWYGGFWATLYVVSFVLRLGYGAYKEWHRSLGGG